MSPATGAATPWSAEAIAAEGATDPYAASIPPVAADAAAVAAAPAAAPADAPATDGKREVPSPTSTGRPAQADGSPLGRAPC
jgi:hypothetical protein